jgi:hypothetical protein
LLLENKNAFNNRQVVLPFQFNAIELNKFPEINEIQARNAEFDYPFNFSLQPFPKNGG